MKKLIVIVLIASVVAAGVYYWRHRQAGAAADAPKLVTAEVERGRIESSVSTTGRVVPNLEVEIKCKASGEVTRLPYDVSDSVEKGELLIELDPVDERRFVKQAEESLSASQARLAQARQSLLIAENNLATEERRAEATLKSAEARAHDALAKSVDGAHDLMTGNERQRGVPQFPVQYVQIRPADATRVDADEHLIVRSNGWLPYLLDSQVTNTVQLCRLHHPVLIPHSDLPSG